MQIAKNTSLQYRTVNSIHYFMNLDQQTLRSPAECLRYITSILILNNQKTDINQFVKRHKENLARYKNRRAPNIDYLNILKDCSSGADESTEAIVQQIYQEHQNYSENQLMEIIFNLTNDNCKTQLIYLIDIVQYLYEQFEVKNQNELLQTQYWIESLQLNQHNIETLKQLSISQKKSKRQNSMVLQNLDQISQNENNSDNENDRNSYNEIDNQENQNEIKLNIQLRNENQRLNERNQELKNDINHLESKLEFLNNQYKDKEQKYQQLIQESDAIQNKLQQQIEELKQREEKKTIQISRLQQLQEMRQLEEVKHIENIRMITKLESYLELLKKQKTTLFDQERENEFLKISLQITKNYGKEDFYEDIIFNAHLQMLRNEQSESIEREQRQNPNILDRKLNDQGSKQQ